MATDPSTFDIIERAVVCITPIILALIGLQSSRSQKKAQSIVDMQKQIQENAEEKEKREKEELEAHFSKLENSISEMRKQFKDMESTVTKLSNLDKQLQGLYTLNSANLELCQSLSNIVSSIGDALDSTDSIQSGNLKQELQEHRKKQDAVTIRMAKIMY